MGIRETAFEATYRISLWKDFAIQPNYQFIVDPSGDKNLADAHVVGLQAEIGM